jgi:LmbE family N-acetylglucosaminyl deacetylase
MTTLYLSPHLDDVALSCAASLLQRIDRGENVVVATLFTHGAGCAARRAEDTAALRDVGAKAVHLGFLDAPDRLRVAPSFESLVLAPALDRKLVAQVARSVRALVRKLRPVRVFFPLGIGGHVDHRTLFEAWPAAGSCARFYEEQPYAFVPSLRALRLLELRGGRLRTSAGRIEQELRSVRLLDAFFSEAERPACVAELSARLAVPHTRRFALRARLLRFSPSVARRTAALTACYRTQCPAIFGKEQPYSAIQRLAGDGIGGVVERELRIRRGGRTLP